MNTIGRVIICSVLLITCYTNAHATTFDGFGAQVRGNDLKSGKSDEVGGAGDTFAEVINLPQYRAEAGLGGSTYTPILRTFASNPNRINDDDRTSSTAEAYQTFQNTSASVLNVALDITLDADFTATGPNADSYALADVWIYGGSAFDVIDSSICAGGSLGRSMMLGDAYFCGQRLGRANMFLETDGQPTNQGSIEEQLLFSVAPDEFFGVYGILRGNGVDGESDAFNTLSMLFDDVSAASLEADGIPQASVVPVPAAVWLFGSALIGFLGFSKKRL